MRRAILMPSTQGLAIPFGCQVLRMDAWLVLAGSLERRARRSKPRIQLPFVDSKVPFDRSGQR